MKSRRKFLSNAALLAMSPLFVNGLYGCKEQNSTVKKAMDKGFSIDQFGIQLWTVRDFMEENPLLTLKTLGEYGYKQIESFQGERGIFWGLTPTDYKEYLAEQGMTCISAHCDSQFASHKEKEDEFKKLADDAASIGIQYLINPWMGNLKTQDEFKQIADDFNRLGKIAKAAGLTYGYHNHSYSFTPIDGVYPQDIMMEGTDPGLVEYEMDIYWVVNADEDPVKWMRKYPNRFTLSHIKDKYADAKVTELQKDPDAGNNFSCVLGTGKIDFDSILEVAKEQGMKQWIVEQERYDDMTSMDAAKADAAFMKKYVS